MTSDIATLMVVVDGDHPVDADLHDVGVLARDLGASIIGISASDHAPSFYFAAGAVAGDVLEQDEERMRERMGAAEKRFRNALQGLQITAEWRSAVDLPIDVVIREARAADLVVCFARRDLYPYSDVDAGELVLKSGRPVLVVPAGAAWRPPGRILITWKESREARRAVSDALPLLRRAKDVRVVEIAEGEDSPRMADARVGDVVAWLKRHGIAASKQVVARDGDVIDAVVKAAQDFDADWIVAGAYGHTRLGEWIFGGVTRHLLTESSRPAFLSH